MGRLKKWLDEPAGEFNGVEPYAPRRVVMFWYGVLTALITTDVYLAVTLIR